MIGRKTGFEPQAFVPAVRHSHERRIEMGTKRFDQRGQGISEVAILSPTEAVASHDDARAVELLVIIFVDERLVLVRRKQRLNDCRTIGVEFGIDSPPIQCLDAPGDTW